MQVVRPVCHYFGFILGRAVSYPLSDLLKSWGECDGHAYGSSVGLVDWATVCLVVIIDVDTHALHRSCLRHRWLI